MTDTYRIAMFGHKSIPSREGGIEVVVQELAARMVRNGHQVTCLNRAGDHRAFQDKPDQVIDKTYKGRKIIKVPTINKAGLAAASSSFFAAFMTAFGPYDIVHIHAEGPAAFCWLPRLFGKKVVVTIHGLDWQRDKWHGFARRYIHFGEKMAARYADAMIVLSRSMKQYFKDTYGRPSVLIPNGVAPSDPVETDMITRTHGLDRDGYILYLGRIVPEKRADMLVRAYRSVKTDKKLVIAGPISDKDEYHQKVIKLAAEDPRIIFPGFVNGRLQQELYSNAYLYVLPSKLEGMPLSLLEAMGYGSACVTSDIPECREVIGSKGYFVDPDDEKQLGETLQFLIDQPDLVEENRRQIREIFSRKSNWDQITLKTQKLYEILMKKKRGRKHAL